MGDMKFSKDGNKLILERTIKAPREKVWEAFTTPELFAQWWGPRGWETTVKHMDFTEGGYVLYGMKCVDESQGEWFGQESWGKEVFKSIDAKNSYIYTDYFTDNEGNVTEGMPAADTTMVFEEDGEGTKITSTTTYDREEDLQKVIEMGMEQGVRETWDRLEELLEGKQ